VRFTALRQTFFVASVLCACASPKRVPAGEAAASLKQTRESEPSAFCAPRGPEVCLDGVDNNCNGLSEEGCGVAQGTVHFFVSWKRPEVDIDLVVVDPSGATAEVGAVSRGGLLKERECPGKSEASCKEGVYENVVLVASRQPMPGRYRVEVTADPAPAEAVMVVLTGRLGSQLIREQFSLDSMVSTRKFDWSLPSVP
jgi:hypothetical protein